ncbi:MULTISPECIES: hypothetical protein [Brucella/Ochrobactrum group]|uniref:hypothetical protein n=1 Tax=Brucella/Ochrobactrum group TaxID=2826938 RepID=UPI00111CEC2A|nr:MULTISPECIES: hypothetical protein [Brucella/Ochrobactrum group]
MTNPFTEFFAKYAETLRANNAKAENADSVRAYIENALSLDNDEDDFDDEDAYDFEPVPEDNEPAPRFTP